MDQGKIDRLGFSIAMSAASQTKTTIGLLGAEITEAQIYDAHSGHRVRLDEIERRILAIEEKLKA